VRFLLLGSELVGTACVGAADPRLVRPRRDYEKGQRIAEHQPRRPSGADGRCIALWTYVLAVMLALSPRHLIASTDCWARWTQNC
jgi:hypothetical protein